MLFNTTFINVATNGLLLLSFELHCANASRICLAKRKRKYTCKTGLNSNHVRFIKVRTDLIIKLLHLKFILVQHRGHNHFFF